MTRQTTRRQSRARDGGKPRSKGGKKGTTRRDTTGRPAPLAALADAAMPEHETRDRILAAAHRVFLAQGTANARTVDIAQAAGVNKALLHYYFSTKATLADAVFARAIDDFMPRIFGILGNPTMSIEEKIHAFVREQMEFHGARPYLAGYVASEMYTEPERLPAMMAARGRPPLAALQQQLDTEIAAGRMRPISVEMFAVNMMALVVFPFVVRPMIQAMIGIDAERFAAFLEERKRQLPALILASLRP